MPFADILKPYDQEHLLGTAGTNSNMCLDGDSIYLRTGNRCLRIDLATGTQLQEYTVPVHGADPPGVWGYIACADGRLFGTRANEGHVVRYLYISSDMTDLLTESEVFFALDVETGDEIWSYTPEHSLRHNAVAVGGGKVFLIDRPLVIEDTPGYVGDPPVEQTTGTLLCLDSGTGNVLWQRKDDSGTFYGTTLALSTQHDVLVVGYQYSQRSYQLPSELGDRLAGFRASDGTPLWSAGDRYISRPLINGLTVYTQPYARDLVTGERDNGFLLDDRSPGGCGNVSGSANLLLYRSGTLGYTDLVRRVGTENYGGIRPGCWINAISAGGLVLMPDATDRCTCSYLIKASIALQSEAATFPPDRDSDGDGLTGGEELSLGTDPLDSDTDDDGMPDGWEVTYSLDPNSGADATLDADDDGHSNLAEYQAGTDPSDPASFPVGPRTISTGGCTPSGASDLMGLFIAAILSRLGMRRRARSSGSSGDTGRDRPWSGAPRR